MAKKKEWTKTMRGKQLLAPGDIIQLMEQGELLKCRVLSCLATEEGACFAHLEIAEGDRTGERIESLIRAGEEPPGS